MSNGDSTTHNHSGSPKGWVHFLQHGPLGSNTSSLGSQMPDLHWLLLLVGGHLMVLASSKTLHDPIRPGPSMPTRPAPSPMPFHGLFNSAKPQLLCVTFMPSNQYHLGDLHITPVPMQQEYNLG
ncbi:hypothetical protein EWB00_001631 [Schistosoma japonicum]|uniref:Uncharacterized protein n=1 Tax=Schistosoma japonicum TaxID=6182 RepID=A0A4Z2CK58_SCHJA|nr:hypothetical protein EWB00_001631 [Schistosoma japonicum]